MSGAERQTDEVVPERVWLDALHELGRPVAHEVKNALNGVAVNLEVVRTRAVRPDVPASSVARFADAAAEQLQSLTELTDALLALVRPVAEPPDLVLVLGRLVTLLGAVARPEGGRVELHVVPDGAAIRVGVAGDGVRALLGALLLAAFARGEALTCELDGRAAPQLRLRRADGPLPPMPSDVEALAAPLGVRLDAQPGEWIVEFPPAEGGGG